MSDNQAMRVPYTLTAPLIISSRLMPALVVAGGTETAGTIHAEIDHYDGERFVLRYVIDYPGGSHAAADIRSAVIGEADYRGDDAALSELLRSLFGALVSFLANEGDRYRARMSDPGDTLANDWGFSAGVAEWAYLNSDELTMAELELSGDVEE